MITIYKLGMVRIIEKRLYLMVSKSNLRTSSVLDVGGEGWFAISNKVQPWTHRQECLMDG